MSAPTRAGKSLAFELAPYAFDRLLGKDCDAIVFVIFPLISLVKYLVSSFNCRGIRASYVGDNISINWCLEVLDSQQLSTHFSSNGTKSFKMHAYSSAGLFRGWRVTGCGWLLTGDG